MTDVPSLAEQIAVVQRRVENWEWFCDDDHRASDLTRLEVWRAVLASLLEREHLRAIADVARRYRAAETDGTPRMWRGKQIQDLANELDDALAGLEPAPPQDGAAAATGETGERDG